MKLHVNEIKAKLLNEVLSEELIERVIEEVESYYDNSDNLRLCKYVGQDDEKIREWFEFLYWFDFLLNDTNITVKSNLIQTFDVYESKENEELTGWVNGYNISLYEHYVDSGSDDYLYTYVISEL